MADKMKEIERNVIAVVIVIAAAFGGVTPATQMQVAVYMMNMTGKMKEIKRNVIAVAIVIATVFGGVVPATQVQAAVYREENVEIVYKGDGEVTKTLSTGQVANVSVDGGVMSIIVDGKKYGGTYQTPCVGSFTIAADDLLHVFWVTGGKEENDRGNCFAYDLHEDGVYMKICRNAQQKYCAEDATGAIQVIGTSTRNAKLENKTPLIDNRYFYEYGKSMKQRLITREEFENIVNPQPDKEPDKPTEPTQPDNPTKPTQPDKPTIDIDSDTHIKFDFEFWWEKYTEGTITWEQLTEVVWKYNWKVESQVTEREVTYYFYDEEGKLIRTERELISSGTENGTGSGSSSESNNGNANYEEKEEGNGGVNGTIDSSTHTTININKPILGSGNTTNALTKYPDRTVNTKPNKSGWIKVKFYQGGVSPKQYTSYTKFNKKKGIMTFNKLRFTKMVDCGYISETRNVYFLKRKKGKICELYTLPRNAKRRTQMRKIPGKYVSVQKNTWGMATKATKSNGNIIDLVAKDKKFNKK